MTELETAKELIKMLESNVRVLQEDNRILKQENKELQYELDALIGTYEQMD